MKVSFTGIVLVMSVSVLFAGQIVLSFTTTRVVPWTRAIKSHPSLSIAPLHQTYPIRRNVSIPSTITSKTSTRLLAAPLLNPTVMLASVSATVKLLSSIGLGTLYTPRGPKFLGNILDPSAISILSKLTFWIFQPCFLFTGVAGTLSTALGGGSSSAGGLSPQALFLLPLAALLQISMGFLLANIYTTSKLRNPLLGISQDDDETASDIKMCATFANSGPLPLIFADALFQMKKGIYNDVAACVSFYLLIWSPMFWTLGRIILGSYKDNKTKDGLVNWRIQLQNRLGLIFSPPVVGSLLGLIVGSQSNLRNLFFQSSGLFHPLYSAAKSFGYAYLPAALLVLAGSLVGTKATTSTNTAMNPTSSNVNTFTSSSSSRIHPKTIITLLCSRFILAPMVALAAMRLLTFFNLLPTSNPRSLAIVTYTLLCEGCMPPAQNSVVMLQLDGKRDRAAKMAKLLTVLYTLATIPITFLLSACLSLSGILNYS